MSSEAGDAATVMVVEDELNLLELYEVWLSEEYSVRSAVGGETALDRLDSTVDAMVLDRRMPNLSGDELLRQVREEGWSCPVALVSAAEPDFDLLELAFDAHLTKPVTQDEFKAGVSRLLEVRDLDPAARTLYQHVVTRTLLQEAKSLVELEASDGFDALMEGIEKTMADMDDGRIDAVKRLVP